MVPVITAANEVITSKIQKIVAKNPVIILTAICGFFIALYPFAIY